MEARLESIQKFFSKGCDEIDAGGGGVLGEGRQGRPLLSKVW